MQTERFVPLSPQVADASFALDDERLDAKILESRSQFEARLATAGDDHDGPHTRAPSGAAPDTIRTWIHAPAAGW